ncbi:acid phosphatase [Magnaporthiopsis poae ATCC 64411]|uniref:acid phosphatase n=1 Tax=Magnaporthiopsis poae (strain ATCC 64411 / 73-15) TaxID=644358 RepID=A0A0C4E047_MAGP6|nr:acid phosphatase [Magnaporthiopsis poae ATCC 64411]
MRLSTVFVGLAALLGSAASAGLTGPPVVKKGGRPKQEATKMSLDEIRAAQATARVSSPTSNVWGVAFDRFIQIWLENTNFQAAAGDPNFQWLASQGILLTNHFGVTHPSQPNYAAAAAGDHFGMDSGDYFRFPEGISTVVDLLDTKNVSWAAYQEHLPYAGYQGFNFSNQETYANDYMRKHNPLILFDSITNNPDRLAQIKNFTSFEQDLRDKKLPQWMFMTPNMTNDGHDTNYRFSGRWARSFLEPLLKDTHFMNRTLIMLTFDENEVYPTQNRVFTVLLGGAVNPGLRGTKDSMFYNHYSSISTVSANWGLPSLGRWDCGANILAVVANQTGYQNVMPGGGDGRGLDSLFFNVSYPGPASTKLYTPDWWPVPDTKSICAAGHGVLPAVVKNWSGMRGPAYNYSDAFPYDDRSGINTAAARVKGKSVNSGAAPAGGNASSSDKAKIENRSGRTSTGLLSAGGVAVLAAGLLSLL